LFHVAFVAFVASVVNPYQNIGEKSGQLGKDPKQLIQREVVDDMVKEGSIVFEE